MNYIANFKDVIIIYKGEETNYFMLYKNILRTNLFKENQLLKTELYKYITENIFSYFGHSDNHNHFLWAAKL